jgi:hypothetical protein
MVCDHNHTTLANEQGPAVCATAVSSTVSCCVAAVSKAAAAARPWGRHTRSAQRTAQHTAQWGVEGPCVPPATNQLCLAGTAATLGGEHVSSLTPLTLRRLEKGMHYRNEPEDDVWDHELSSGDEEGSTLVAGAGAGAARPAAAQQTAGWRGGATDGRVPAGAGGKGSGAVSVHAQQSESKTLVVRSGIMKQRRLRLLAGEMVGWSFHEEGGHRVDFRVCFVQAGMGLGDEIRVAPSSSNCRLASHRGTYQARTNGELVLMFDNYHSWWKAKVVQLDLTKVSVARYLCACRACHCCTWLALSLHWGG